MKKIYFLLLLAIPMLISSCSKNDNEPDFDVPELTDANTIQFTFEANEKLDVSEIYLHGEKLAIDWGDGTLQKSYLNFLPFSHKYAKSGTYRIKIWTEHLTFCNVSTLLQKISTFSIGNSPKLETLIVNSFSDLETFDLGTKCPELRSLNLGNSPLLHKVDVSKCTNLETFLCYTNPKLESLDVSQCKKLQTLNCGGNSLKTLLFADNAVFRELDCAQNQLEALDLSKIAITYSLQIQQNKFTTIDISNLVDLNLFRCDSNNLASLDLTKNVGLVYFSCLKNQLKELDLTNNQKLRLVYIAKNQFETNALNTIFGALPESPVKATRTSAPSPQPNEIWFEENPGATTCNSQIIKDKFWNIYTTK